MPEGLLGRVRKLLAKAEDPAVTAAEAELYNAKAAELIARHGIDAALLAATGQTRDEVAHRVIAVDNPYARDKAHLLTSVADPLRCQTVHTYRPGSYGCGCTGSPPTWSGWSCSTPRCWCRPPAS